MNDTITDIFLFLLLSLLLLLFDNGGFLFSRVVEASPTYHHHHHGVNCGRIRGALRLRDWFSISSSFSFSSSSFARGNKSLLPFSLSPPRNANCRTHWSCTTTTTLRIPYLTLPDLTWPYWTTSLPLIHYSSTSSIFLTALFLFPPCFQLGAYVFINCWAKEWKEHKKVKVLISSFVRKDMSLQLRCNCQGRNSLTCFQPSWPLYLPPKFSTLKHERCIRDRKVSPSLVHDTFYYSLWLGHLRPSLQLHPLTPLISRTRTPTEFALP